MSLRLEQLIFAECNFCNQLEEYKLWKCGLWQALEANIANGINMLGRFSLDKKALSVTKNWSHYRTRKVWTLHVTFIRRCINGYAKKQ